MEKTLGDLLEQNRHFVEEGRVADYIPELAKANYRDFGAYITKCDGTEIYAGDYEKTFTIQSICKPMLLLLALMDNGEEHIRHFIGVEATGKPFNAIDYSEQLILKHHINPMVNIGAIAICSMIKSDNSCGSFKKFLNLVRLITDNPKIEVDEKVYQSEKTTGNKNRALAYLLKSSNVIDGDIEEILDIYFRACSIKVTCRDLSQIGAFLAGHGRTIKTSKNEMIPENYIRFVNAILMTCGMYDGSGDFAIRVGIPAKSGVGGGIMALVPRNLGIGIYSPSLDSKGNSIAGIRLLEALSKEFKLSVF